MKQLPENLFGRSQLLYTKLHLPLVQSAILRPHLFEKLSLDLNHKLILISAPAGFGKTTLAANWLSQLNSIYRYTWLSLDENDNDLRRFLSYLMAALQKIDAHIGRGLQDILRTFDLSDIDAVLTALLNDIVAINEELIQQHSILVLDDYHVLDNPAIDEAVLFLLDHLPAHFHLMLLSRIDPTLPLGRLRAKRQLIEVRERDLRFSVDETHLFLTDIMDISLPSDDIRLLHARTEGWIAGLQLASLALQNSEPSFVAEFSGTHRYILDYLTDEVFQHQTPELQQFLLETSVLNRMCAELCDHLRQTNNSQMLLETLEHANLFVVPLDQQRRWYRYHHLFADLLRQRMRQTMPENIHTLHERASAWYASFAVASEDEAAVDESIHHAVAAQNHEQIAALLERFGDDIWERGEHDKLRRWLTLLPEGIILSQPKLSIFQSWLDFSIGQYSNAEASLSRAELGLNEAANIPELRGRITAIRAFIATFRGDLQNTARFAEQALQQLSPQSRWRASAAIALGDAYSISGNIVTAGEVYQEVLNSTHAAGNLYLALNAGFKLATIQRQRGLLREAYMTCSQQIAFAEKAGLAQTVMAGCLYALRGDILCEWNNLAEGLAQTQQALETSGQTRHVGFAGWIMLFRTRSLLAARDIEQADETLRRMESLARETPLPPWIVSPMTALRVLLWLAQGEMEQALAWVKNSSLSLDDTRMFGREFEYLAFVRLLAMQGEIDLAQTVLTRLFNVTHESQRASLSLIILLTQALLFQVQRKPDAALQAAVDALYIGEKGDFVRSFLDVGTPLVPLLQAAKAQGISPTYTHRLLTLMTTESSPQSPPPDTLSEREQEVLLLIANGLKNQAIADQLVISLNTVLYHTKNIYSKLHVTHRTQAVQRARELNLL